jgi:hypothetical protein
MPWNRGHSHSIAVSQKWRSRKFKIFKNAFSRFKLPNISDLLNKSLSPGIEVTPGRGPFSQERHGRNLFRQEGSHRHPPLPPRTGGGERYLWAFFLINLNLLILYCKIEIWTTRPPDTNSKSKKC